MKSDELRDRKKFVEMQIGIVADRLNMSIESNRKSVHTGIDRCSKFEATDLDLEPYVIFKCNSFEEYCDDFILSFLNNLVLSKTKIDSETYTNLYKVKYIFHVFKNKIRPTGLKLQALININTGEIAINKDGSILNSIGEDFYRIAERLQGIQANKEKSSAERNGKLNLKACILDEKKIYKENHKGLIERYNAKQIFENPTAKYKIKETQNDENPQFKNISIQLDQLKEAENIQYADHSKQIGPLTVSLYKHKLPSFEFINMNFYTLKFASIENLFIRPFSFFVSLEDLKNYIAIEKAKSILTKLQDIKNMSQSDLFYLNSFDYYKTYGYSEILSFEETQQNLLSDLLSQFLSDVEESKAILLLNFILNVAPGFISSVDFNKYKEDPHFFMIQWANNYNM